MHIPDEYFADVIACSESEAYNWALHQCIEKYGWDFKPCDVIRHMNYKPSDDDVEW